MDDNLFFAVLRVSAAQILRNAGLAGAKPSVLDAFTDMIARYLVLLGTTSRSIAESSGRTNIEINDARGAMEHVGLLRPLRLFDDPDGEDTRGVDAFVEWAMGPEPEEMRRIAGVGLEDDEDVDATPPAQEEEEAEPRPPRVKKTLDWLTILKHKELKSGEEERYKGTILGMPADAKPVVIEGGDGVSLPWVLG